MLIPRNNRNIRKVDIVLLNFNLSTIGFNIHDKVYPKNKGLSIDINIQHIPTNLSSLIMYILMNIINNFISRSI